MSTLSKRLLLKLAGASTLSKPCGARRNPVFTILSEDVAKSSKKPRDVPAYGCARRRLSTRLRSL